MGLAEITAAYGISSLETFEYLQSRGMDAEIVRRFGSILDLGMTLEEFEGPKVQALLETTREQIRLTTRRIQHPEEDWLSSTDFSESFLATSIQWLDLSSQAKGGIWKNVGELLVRENILKVPGIGPVKAEKLTEELKRGYGIDITKLSQEERASIGSKMQVWEDLEPEERGNQSLSSWIKRWASKDFLSNQIYKLAHAEVEASRNWSEVLLADIKAEMLNPNILRAMGGCFQAGYSFADLKTKETQVELETTRARIFPFVSDSETGKTYAKSGFGIRFCRSFLDTPTTQLKLTPRVEDFLEASPMVGNILARIQEEPNHRDGYRTQELMCDGEILNQVKRRLDRMYGLQVENLTSLDIRMVTEMGYEPYVEFIPSPENPH